MVAGTSISLKGFLFQFKANIWFTDVYFEIWEEDSFNENFDPRGSFCKI